MLVGDLLIAGAEIADETVDALVTDPPYGREHLALWSKLGTLAERVLKPGGWLVVMAPQAHLPGVVKALGEHAGLTYRWMLSYQLPTGPATQLQNLRLNIRWKPVLLYTKGKLARIPTYGDDVVENVAHDDDRHDEGWGQGVDGFTKLVAGVTRAEETVLDPFLGSGTTAEAALLLGRCFVGIDIDERYVHETWHRLTQQARTITMRD